MLKRFGHYIITGEAVQELVDFVVVEGLPFATSPPHAVLPGCRTPVPHALAQPLQDLQSLRLPPRQGALQEAAITEGERESNGQAEPHSSRHRVNLHLAFQPCCICTHWCRPG